jgi:hypothetical protein
MRQSRRVRRRPGGIVEIHELPLALTSTRCGGSGPEAAVLPAASSLACTLPRANNFCSTGCSETGSSRRRPNVKLTVLSTDSALRCPVKPVLILDTQRHLFLMIDWPVAPRNFWSMRNISERSLDPVLSPPCSTALPYFFVQPSIELAKDNKGQFADLKVLGSRFP